MNTSMTKTWVLLLLITVMCGLTSCGGSSSSPADSNTAQVNLLLGDAPVDTLSSFSVTVTSISLTLLDDTATANLLGASQRVNLLDLVTRSALLQVADLPTGTYKGVRIEIDAASVSARDLVGAAVAVQVQSSVAIAAFASTLTVAPGDSAKLGVEIDVDESLSDNPGGGLIFVPTLFSGPRSGTDDSLDEIHGRVVSSDEGANRIAVELVDRETGTALGNINVELDTNASLFRDNGTLFSNSAEFFSAATTGKRIEASGVLRDGGILLANLVKLEEESHGVARIEGTITDIDLGTSQMTIRILEIERGVSLVQGVLAALGDPSEIVVGLGNAIVVIDEPTPRSGAFSDLRVGQKTKLKFSAFAAAPFPVRRIEINDERPEFEGAVSDTAGLPGTLVIRLEPHDPTVLSGAVASTSTDVTVQLSGDEPIFLKLPNENTVSTNALFVGVELRVRGTIGGSPSAPTIAADDLRIRPGRLDGTVTSVNENLNQVVIDVDSVGDPFVVGALNSPVVCGFAGNVAVERDATNVAELFALFDALQPGETLEVRLFGISDGSGGIIAHRIKAERK